MSFQESAMEGAEPQTQAQAISGWAVGFTAFAGVLMIVAGMFQFFEGLAALIEDDFFALARAYAFDMSVTAWGWLHMLVGVIVALCGFLLFTGNLFARIVAIAIAVISAVVNFFYIPYYPVWSIVIIALAIGVIWALTAHGRDIAAAE